MTNRIVQALEHGATKLGKTLGEDAGKAVKDLYHSTGHNLTGIAEDTAATDAKHAHALSDLLRDGKDETPHAPHAVDDEGHLPHGDGHEPPLGGEHAPGQPSEGNSGCTTGGDPVDVVSGQMITSATDVDLPGLLPLVLRRAYASGYGGGRWFGPGWSGTVDQRVQIDADGIHYAGEDAEIQTYPLPTPEQPRVLPEFGAQRPLTWDRDEGEDTVRIEDTATGWTRHFAAPEGRPGARTRTITALTDRNGHRIDYVPGPDGLPAEVRHCGGYRVAVDTIGTLAGPRISGLRLLDGDRDGSDGIPLVQYAYDDRGHLTGITDSTGLPLTYTYDVHDRITSWTDRNGHWYAYEYGRDGRVTHGHGPQGALEAHFTYDTANRSTSVVDSLGATTTFYYDRDGHVTRTVDPLGSTVHTEHDRFGRLLAHTDALGATSRLTRDGHGDVARVDRPDGAAIRITYNALRLPVQIETPDGQAWRQSYDERGNRTALTDGSGATTRYTYDASGRLTSVTDAVGHTTQVRCNPAGLLTEAIDPRGGRAAYGYDAFGRPVTSMEPTGATTGLEWTVEGRLARRTMPDGTQETWTYDGEGNRTRHIDPVGGVSRFEYTHFDQLTACTGPDGVRHEFAHDTELRLTAVTNPQGLTWNYAYDLAGRLLTETDFDDRTLTYTYDAANRLVSRGNALGETVAFERDALGQVLRKDAAGQVTAYAYNPAGQLAQATGPDGTVLTLLRDQYGRLYSETVDGRTLSHTYDTLGRRTSRTTPTGATTVWSYDAAGNRVGMEAAGRAIDFAYDQVGREVSRRFDDTVSLKYAYDPLGRLSTQSVTGTDGRTLQHRAYSYRADGYVTGIEDQLDGVRHFDLDRAGRVTAVRAADWTERYAYDSAGNQTQASWPTGHPGQGATGARAYTGTRITRAGNVRYEHDALGRIVLRQKTRLSRKPDTWRYEWDAEDRLTAVVTPDGTVWRYTYDPLGRRTAKLRLGADGETVVERVDFTWDGTTLCEQTTTANAFPNQIILTWDHQGLDPISQTERITATDAPQQEIDTRFFAIVTDLVGSPRELIDEQGTVVWRTHTTLWGTTAWNTDATAYTPLRFPGQYSDPETGLHHNYFRHYDPETARYLTPDPLGLTPAPNPNAYVHNPHTWTDPLGLSPETPLEWIDPGEINFSQRTVSPNDYVEKMRAGEWDWTRPGTALQVMRVDGQLVSYDNRRLDAAREVGQPVAVVHVNPDDPHPASTTGRTWAEAFERRMTSGRNRDRNGNRVPRTGLNERPIVEQKKGCK